MDVIVIPDSDDEGPPRRRRAVEGAAGRPVASAEIVDLEGPVDVQTGDNHVGLARAIASSSNLVESSSGARDWIAPFQLFRANGIPDYANRYSRYPSAITID